MKAAKYIVDTTLRDGEQSPGFALTREQKVFLAQMMDEAGVDQIEAGIPAIGAYEKETLLEIAETCKKSKIAAWNRIVEEDIRQSFACKPDIIHISAPVSYAQIYAKLHKNKTWVIRQLASCVELALSEGYEVTVGYEDASRADMTFLTGLTESLVRMGVKRVRIADTVGVLTPSRTFKMINDLKSYTGAEIEMHAHNDLGMAVANSMAAARAGADYIDTTLLGIGERAGNCDMQKFIYACESAFSIKITRFTALLLEEKASRLLVR